MRDWRTGVSARLRSGPVAKAARTLGVECDEPVDVGVRPAGSAEPLDGRLEQARDAREVERPVEEPFDGDVVGGDQRRRRARPGPAGVARDAQRREARLVGRRGSRAGRWRSRSAAAAGEGRRSG